MSITTTAEGIETAEQLDVLLANGYNEGQGYLFGRPIGRAEVASVIERFKLG
ncbi:hypothetical protein [Siccirubricoccus soli]|uniref:hypothetical protein n=1 Tax=Siccirubricoccus soli TaxID=2899147 RepID=UPI0035133D98